MSTDVSEPEQAAAAAAPQSPNRLPLATWSLVLGVLGLVCLGPLAAIPAVICGHIARSRIRTSQGQLTGGDIALVGLITGYIGMVLGVITVAIATAVVIPALLQARVKAKEVMSANNVRQLTLACFQYAQDNDTLPVSLEALVDSNPAVSQQLLVSPLAEDGREARYELVASGRLSDHDSPSTTILIREVAPGAPGKRAVGYLDGHVETVRDSSVNTRGSPEP